MSLLVEKSLKSFLTPSNRTYRYIFCRNIAEKFILKFAKLFYIKKHEDLCHFPAQFVISITKN